MKKIMTTLAMVFVAGLVSANIAIDFKNTGGWVTQTAGEGSGVTDSLIQLIWSPVDPTATRAIDTGDHTLLGEFVLKSVIDASWGTWDSGNVFDLYDDGDVGGVSGSDAVILGGYIFVRMFDNTLADVDDYYLQQFVTGSLVAYDEFLPSTIYDSNLFIGSDADGFTGVTDMNLQADSYQVIPEPAVAALLGILGGGLLVARRLFSGQS